MKVIHFSIIALMTVSLFGTAAIFGQITQEKEQILIKDNIKSFDWYGLEYQSDYVDTFTPPKAFDNKLITPQQKNVGWSQLGDSGFTVSLQNQVDKICSAEIIPLNPKNSPFLLTVGSKSVEGKLDSTSIPVSFLPDCAKNVSLIKFDIKSSNDKYNPIQEIKLFTQKTDPDIDPPVCPPNSYWDEQLKKCVAINPPIGNETAIINSTIALNVSNSTITINADKTSEIITEQTPIGTPLNKNDEEEEDEEKEDSKN